MPSEPHLLTTEQVAARLGVKPATVYAYVSRGLLTSMRNADGKGSLFARADVDAFVAGRRRATTPGIQTGITLIRDGGLYYRGVDAARLARTSTFEAVATLLWTGALEHVDLVAKPELTALAEATVRPLPADARTTDRLRVIVAAAAAADPLRFDTSAPAVIATGRTMLATMIDALPPAGPPQPAAAPPPAAPPQPATVIDTPRPAGPPQPAAEVSRDPDADAAGGASRLAEALWPRLTARPPGAGDCRVLNAALILLADHDIAASTLAARIAASTRAHPYAVVSAGLAALDGPLHGAASGLAYALLKDAMDNRDPVATIAARLRADGLIPGFGHALYPDGDPRAATLLDLLGDGPARDTATRLARAVRDRSGTRPNVDFALAALCLHHGMPADAGEAIFAVARTAGWLAHALEEYADRPSRFRPVGQYAGRTPSA
jgi:citrate synthase